MKKDIKDTTMISAALATLASTICKEKFKQFGGFSVGVAC